MIPGFLNLSQNRACRKTTSYLGGIFHPRRPLGYGKNLCHLTFACVLLCGKTILKT